MLRTTTIDRRARRLVWRGLSGNLAYVGRLGTAVGLRFRDPTFIVGTGRCGTDLLVDILKTHPRLTCFPGEANELWHPRLYPFEMATESHAPIEVDPRDFTAVSLRGWPPHQKTLIRDTFAGFQLLSGSSKLLVVKSAMISFLIPTIVEIFSSARFIHIYRSGPSVVESYMKKNFGTYPGYDFGWDEYRLVCARYWNDCILEIDRAGAQLRERGALFELGYEDLCSHTERRLDDLARYLDVEPGAFGFDTSMVRTQNHKVGDYASDPVWREPLKAMEPGMKLKGYIR